MKALVLAFAVLAAGCHTPCDRTARHAMAMGRACKEVGDETLKKTCEAAYESVGNALASGKCSNEVTR